MENNKTRTIAYAHRQGVLNNATNAGVKRQNGLAAKKGEVYEAQKEKYRAQAAGGNNVRAGKTGKTGNGSAKSKFSIHSKK